MRVHKRYTSTSSFGTYARGEWPYGQIQLSSSDVVSLFVTIRPVKAVPCVVVRENTSLIIIPLDRPEPYGRYACAFRSGFRICLPRGASKRETREGAGSTGIIDDWLRFLVRDSECYQSRCYTLYSYVNQIGYAQYIERKIHHGRTTTGECIRTHLC